MQNKAKPTNMEKPNKIQRQTLSLIFNLKKKKKQWT